MSIVTGLYLVLWTVLLQNFDRTANDIHFGGQIKGLATLMITQNGIQFSSMLLCLLTIMLGAGAIANELETGIIHAVISRPLRRFEYVLGKLCGLSILVIIYSTVLFVAIILIGYVFSLETVTTLAFGQIALGWLIYTLVPITVLCLTIYGTVSLKVVPNGLLMIFIYILGNIGGMVEMIGRYINSAAVISSGIFISLISPFHTLFSASLNVLLPSGGIQGDLMRSAGGLSGSGAPPSPLMFAYIAVYSIFFVAMAVRKFCKMDIS